MRTVFSLPTICFVLILLSISTAIAAEHERSPRVEGYLQDANAAMEHLSNNDLAAIEQALSPGFAEIEDMVATYPAPTDEHSRINTYLRERGWGQLVWTQIMVRLTGGPRRRLRLRAGLRRARGRGAGRP